METEITYRIIKLAVITQFQNDVVKNKNTVCLYDLIPFYNTQKYLFTQKYAKYYQLVFEDYEVTCFSFLYYFGIFYFFSMNMTYFYNYENFIFKRHNENVSLFLLKQTPSFERIEG